ncbi:hypothetical protein T492DRAFT_1104533 [Pavlovales sp. CCMP2436]|nr:hypothetical protein T492DRAFT_1104533 [Pavlovales sp. CCMP2436]
MADTPEDGSGSGTPSVPLPPKGLLRVLGLVSKAELDAALAEQRETLGGGNALTAKAAELSAARSDLAARAAEADELKRRDGALTARLRAQEAELAVQRARNASLERSLTVANADSAELGRRELEEAIYVPFSSDYSVRLRSGRVALAIGTNAQGSKVGSALYWRLQHGLALGGSVAYNVQSDVVERMLIGGTLHGGAHSFKVAAERHGLVNMMYSLKLSPSMQVMVKAQLNEQHSTLRNLGASVAFNL